MNSPFQIRLPATSANLGPAFDTAAVALGLYLEVFAQQADAFAVFAEGRDSETCGRLEGNLILETYRSVLCQENRAVVPLCLRVRNSIPLGMGCGSSAAARLAGIALAVHFGSLPWEDDEILSLATHLEGHPDNVSACWLGGMTVSAVSDAVSLKKLAFAKIKSVTVARFDVPQHWSALVALPREPVKTEDSRKVLPPNYSRADTVANLQHSSILVAAFASGSDALLRAAMQDRLHQPYRSRICPLLPKLISMAQEDPFLAVALSGAGPGVLLIFQRRADPAWMRKLLQSPAENADDPQLVFCGFENKGAVRAQIGTGEAT